MFSIYFGKSFVAGGNLALSGVDFVQFDGVIEPVFCISVAAPSPEMVLPSPGTILLPVAPGTFGLSAGLTAPEPGPAARSAGGGIAAVDRAAVDRASVDRAAGMSVHPAKPNPMLSAVKVVTILFTTVFPFIRHDMRRPDGGWLPRPSDRRGPLRCCPWSIG
jgi:hypothetical protein